MASASSICFFDIVRDDEYTLRGSFFASHSSGRLSPRRFSAVSTSSAEKGSSMNKNLRLDASARANPTRCFMPPDNSLGYADSKPCNPTEASARSALRCRLEMRDPAREQRRFHVFQHREPREKREA